MAEKSWSLAGDGVDVAEFPVWTWVLRLAAPTPDVLTALKALFGSALPDKPTTAAGECPRLFWLAPGEWAVLSPAEDLKLAGRIEASCAGTLAHVADLTRGWTAFALTGAGASDLLAKVCGLDLHPRAFAEDRCARTLLGQMPILIERSGSAFRLYVDRSLTHHMRRWLAVSANRDILP
ncbi:MAG: hypothetical protein JWR80_677 [Bradyrhizobium sp.]|nr:hypothetical protein [Bradyrhizobium sp.]